MQCFNRRRSRKRRNKSTPLNYAQCFIAVQVSSTVPCASPAGGTTPHLHSAPSAVKSCVKIHESRKQRYEQYFMLLLWALLCYAINQLL